MKRQKCGRKQSEAQGTELEIPVDHEGLLGAAGRGLCRQADSNRMEIESTTGEASRLCFRLNRKLRQLPHAAALSDQGETRLSREALGAGAAYRGLG